ncbi:interferon-induced 35 kDa protein [Pempheris klunzingeri]|uniref:interferon-induced 35 kDa protein n=1 Tax=Pempheris klunzingeri TaxID=3127111 RepID=UPI0039812859
MSSDEDFSLVLDPQPSEHTLEGIKALTLSYKQKYEQLLKEHQELATSRDDRRNLTEEFRQRTVKLTQSLMEDQQSYEEQTDNEKTQLSLLMQEESELMEELQGVEAALREEEAKNSLLTEQMDVFAAVPEITVVFTGSTGPPLQGAAANTQPFEMKPRIVYPMEEGAALITFEEEVVAKNILSMKKHQVNLGGECRITVEARPVHLMMPSLVEIESEVCHQRILISNLPKMDTDTLLNKLEIHFSKSKHGGGEVEECEMLPDSGTVVLTFVGTNIARGLTDTQHHEIKLHQKLKKHRVRVTPFLNGKITNFETKMKECPRTVLLTGIPDIMEAETLQDLLEIHFQKNSNGGGEVKTFLYNPLGQHTSALFEVASADREEEQDEDK